MIELDAGSGLGLFLVPIEELDKMIQDGSVMTTYTITLGNVTSGDQREIIEIIGRQANSI